MSDAVATVAPWLCPETNVNRFFAEPRVAALAVNAGGDRGPLAVPIWYQYRPGGQPWVLTGADSRKHRLIEAAGCFSLMVERSLDYARRELGENVLIVLEPRHWLSADLGAV